VGFFDGIGNAKVFENGVFLQADNEYKLQVDRMLVKKARKGYNLFIMEATVLTSTSDKDPVGSKRSWVQKLDDADTAEPAMKAYMYALLGYSWPQDKDFLKAQVDPQLTKLTENGVSEANPFKGRSIGVRTVNTTTKAKCLPFTRHDFYATDSKLGS
jgi:hypothetical protein